MTTITLKAITRPGQDMPVRATCLEIKTKNISEHELTVKKMKLGVSKESPQSPPNVGQFGITT